MAVGATWPPASQGPSLDATFYATWAHSFYFCKLHTFAFLLPVSVSFAQEGLRTSFLHFFFRRVFGPARVQIFYVPLLRSVFVLQRQTNVFKSSCGVRGTGPPQGSAFACAVTTVNKTKKQKTKKNTGFVKDCYNNKALCVFTACD